MNIKTPSNENLVTTSPVQVTIHLWIHMGVSQDSTVDWYFHESYSNKQIQLILPGDHLPKVTVPIIVREMSKILISIILVSFTLVFQQP